MNIRERIEAGATILNVSGGKNTPEIVRKIRKDREQTNLSYDKLAEKYGVSKGTISDIIKRRTWKDV